MPKVNKVVDDWLGDPFGSYHQASEAQGAAQVQAAMSDKGIEETKRQFDVAQAALRPYTQAGVSALGYGPAPGGFMRGTVNNAAQAVAGRGNLMDRVVSQMIGAPLVQSQKTGGGLARYSDVGIEGLNAIAAFSGLGDPNVQTRMIQEIEASPEFQAQVKQGEEAILQNAAATGNLRGGDVQRALAEFRPALLSDLINQRFSRLAGLSEAGRAATTNIAQLGQSSAAGTGTAALQTGANVAELLSQKGSAMAGGRIAASKAAGSGLADFVNLAESGTGIAKNLIPFF